MKKMLFFLSMAMFMNMPCFAETFSVENDDGVSITYEITSESTVSVVSGESPYAGNIVIPENVTNNEIQYAVTAIGNMVFNGCSNLTSVTIPNSVVSIGSAAFQNCTNLATVQLGNSVKTISAYAFNHCSALTSVELPNSLETIETRAFQSCDKLESVSFGESIKSIQEATFSSCTSLNKVIFPNISTLFNIEFVSYSSNPLPIAKHIYVKDENGGETEVTNLVIPDGVTEIPNEFFKDVASITSITIPSSVTSIGDNAFNGCTNLATVTFPESSINMGKDVFANTAWISNHQSDDNVVYIGSVLYQYKGDMPENTTIAVKEGTTSIAEGAFKNQTNLVGITIPESVTHIGKDAFTGTTWYDGLEDGPIYINKVLYKYKGTMEANTAIEVTEGTVNIAEGAFENFTQLTKVVLPNTVTTIEKAAFSGCTGLSELTMGDAIASIGDDAFKSCSNLSKIHVSSNDRMFAILYGDAISWGEGSSNPFTLAKHIYVADTEVTELTLPDGMTEINQGFFNNFGKNVTSLTIPGSVTTIGDAAFQDWTKLASVTIGNSVKSIGANAFKGCTALTTIELPIPVSTIGEYAFDGCTNLSSITLGDSVKTIGNWAFNGCSSLTTVDVNTLLTMFNVTCGNSNSNPFKIAPKLSVNGEEITTELVIPEGVTEIKQGFFYNWGSDITSVTIPNSVKKIGSSAFSNWTKLASVAIGDSVKIIGDNAFNRCSSLTAVNIPNSVITIENAAFYYCSNLSSVTLGDSVESIGQYAFNGCDNLQTVNVNKLETIFNSVKYGNSTNNNPFKMASKLHLNGVEVTNLVIPESITELNKGFLYNFGNNVTSVTIPKSVNVGDYAFQNWPKLASVTLGRTGKNAFEGCSALTSITLGASVDTIAAGAFKNCTGLESVVIPNSVVVIENRAFEGCSKLASVTFSESVDSVGEYAFNGCNSLQRVNVTDLDAWYAINFGNESANPLVIAKHLYFNDEEVTGFTIPEGITEINEGFFKGYENIKSITLPKSVKKIGYRAFYNLTNLESVTLNDSLQSIGEDAFRGCTALTAVVIPNSVKTFARNVFYGCTSLSSVTLGDSLQTIGGGSFHDCTSLESIVIPNSVKTIEDRVFESCSNLSYITMGDSVETIGEYTFNGCEKLQTVNVKSLVSLFNLKSNNHLGNPFTVATKLHLNGEEITDLVIPEGVTEIKNGFFYNFWENITSVTIPNSVKTIGGNAFQNWSKLTSASIGNSVKTIGYRAFENCSALATVIIGDSVKTIEYEAFKKTGLTSVTFPNSLELIGRNAFDGCSNLEAVTFGDSIKTILQNVFNGCEKLARVNTTNIAALCNVAYTDVNSNPLRIAKHLYMNDEEVTELVIPEGVTQIAPFAFVDAKGITSLSIPNSVKSIGGTAFNGCTNLAYITWGNSVETIGDWAFDNCDSLKTMNVNSLETVLNSVKYGNISHRNPFCKASKLYLNGEEVTNLVIPESITEIKKGFLYNFGNNVTSVTIPNSVKVGDYAFQNWPKLASVTLERTGKNAFEGCSALTSITLGASVDTIAAGAFRYCKGLESVVIPNTVVAIEKAAFEGCTKLASVTFGDAIASVGSYAFNGCDSLKRVDVTNLDAWYAINFENQSANPLTIAQHLYYNGEEVTGLTIPEGITEINEGFFKGYENIKSIVLPNSVVKIGDRAFKGLANLESVTLSSSLETIGTEAFQYCTSLTAVEIPNSVKALSRNVFFGCTNLQSVTLSDSLRTIAGGSFKECKNLKSIVIPNSVVTLEDGVFEFCTNLSYITLGDSVKSIGSRSFNGCDSLQTVNVNTLLTMFNIQCGGSNANPFSKASKLHLNGKEITELEIPEGVTEINQGFFYNFGNIVTSVTIPNSVKSINGGAFQNWSELESISLGDSIKTVGLYPFSGCDKLTKVNVPNISTLCNIEFASHNSGGGNSNPLSIAKHLYLNGEEVTELIIPDDVTHISNYAFSGASSITSVFIPTSVKSIGEYVFHDCDALSYVTLGDSVKTIGDRAFWFCDSLKTVNIHSLETMFNLTCNGSGSNPFSIASNLHLSGEEVTDLVIPEYLTEINKGFLYNFGNNVTSVTIPNSVKVGDYAFQNWPKLESVTLERTGKNAFEGCSALTSINWGASVDTIAAGAFRYCKGLESVVIPNTVVAIEKAAFEGCTKLSSVTFGDAISSVGSYAFNGCDSLKRVDVTNLDTWYAINFENQSANPLTIAQHLYFNGEEVTGLKIPEGITEINEGFFKGYENIKSIVLPNSVVKIGDRAFKGLANLESVTLSSSLESIGREAFRGCTSLTSIEFPEPLTFIGDHAFDGCTNLESVSLGNQIKTIEHNVFNGCEKLSRVDVTDAAAYFAINFGSDSSNPAKITKGLYCDDKLVTEYVQPYGATEVRGNLLSGYDFITSLVFANSVQGIYGWHMFEGSKSLTKVVLPNSLKYLSERAFGGCKNLRSVTFGDSLTTVGYHAFYQCDSLEDVHIAKLEDWFNIEFGDYHSNPLTKAKHFYSDGKEITELVVPNTVKEIKDHLFEGSKITSLKLGDSVEKIGNSAFASCTALTSVTFGESIDSIETNAFAGCDSLKRVDVTNLDAWYAIYFENQSANPLTIAQHLYFNGEEVTGLKIPEGITEINEGFFKGYKNIKSIVLPNSVVKIGDRAFMGLVNLESVTLSSSLETIGTSAFQNCTALTAIKIPNSVKAFPNEVFRNCTNLASVVLGDSLRTIGQYAFRECKSLKSVVFPNSVVSIGYGAFEDCTNLSYISLGDSVKSIDSYAFNRCDSFQVVNVNSLETMFNIQCGHSNSNPFSIASKLHLNGKEVTDLVIPESISEIKSGMFYKFGKNITSIIIPKSVKKINNYAFNDWSKLASVSWENSVDTIGEGIFQNCVSLTAIEVPNSIKFFPRNVFLGCTNLKSVTLGDSLRTIGGGSFHKCTNLKSIVIPNSVVTIEDRVFEFCTNLSHITLGDSVRTIGEFAFNGCDSLQTVNLNKLGTMFNIQYGHAGNPFSIASKLHVNGKEVTDLVIPEGVTQIHNGFFYNFGKNVTSITIPNSVRTIGADIFYGWPKLATVSIGNSVENIGYRAFYDCAALTTVTMGGPVKNIQWGVFENCPSLTSVHVTDVATLCNSGFERGDSNPLSKAKHLYLNGEEVTDLVIPEGVTQISPYAFFGAEGITSVTIPNSVKSIGTETFSGCKNLSYITLGDSISNFGYCAFNGCDSLTINVAKLEVLFNEFKFDGYRSSPFETATNLCVNNEEIVDLEVPNTVKKIPGGIFNGRGIKSLVIPNSVETIGDNAFNGCEKLATLSLGNSVDTIGAGAFYNCKALTSVEIPNSVKKIGDNAFNGCEKLATLSLGNSVDIIGAGAFYNCKALTSVEIPNSVKVISDQAFRVCDNLSSVTLGDSLQTIGFAAFADNPSLTSIEMPNSVTTLSREAFYNCNNLTSVTLSNSLQTIGERAFMYCRALESIEIPNSVTTIPSEAFYDCYGLESVTLGNSIQSIGEAAFGYVGLGLGNGRHTLTYIPSLDWLFKVEINSNNGNDYLFKELYIGKQPLTALEIPEKFTEAPILPLLYNSCITSLNTGNGLKILPKGRSEKITNLTLGSNLTKIEGEFPNALIVVSNATTPPTITKENDEDWSPFPKCLFDNGAYGVVVLLNPSDQNKYSTAKGWEGMQLTNQSNKVDVLVSTPGELSWEIIDKHNMAPAKVVGLTVRGEINDDDFEQMNLNMKSLLYLDLSNAKVNKVPNNAFDGKQQLLSLQLPSTTKVVGNYAFQGCHGIEELVLPTDLTEIGDGAFAGTNIETLDFNYALQKIGNRAFANTPLKEISFQNKVESIGSEAFQGCNLEQELYFSETLTSIGERAFEGQSGITGHLTIPESVTTVGQRAFSGTNISTVFISGKMTTLESSVFANCPQLNVVYIPDNITRINASAFQGCTSLKDLRLSQKVEEIEREAFRAIPIRSVSVPESVKTLREYTFADCANLRFATLPSTITSLEDGVFYNCRQLMNLTVKALTPPTVADNTFRGVNTDRCIVSIPTESKKEYALATYWGRFIQMRNDIVVQKKGNGSISFASGETAEEGNTPAPVTRATRAATNETESTVTTVEDGSSLYVPKDGTVRFYITPEEGEEIVSATLDGEDITSQIVDGVFVTTADKQSAELVVNFSELTKTAQVITWEQEFEQPVMVGDKITLNAAASSGLSVNFAFGNNESSQFANLSDNTLAIVKPGAIALIAQQKGDNQYASISTDVKYIQAYEYGDANGNREINSADLATTIDYAIGNDPQEFLFRAADVNKDQRVNVADVSGVVDIVLTAPATIDEAELMTRSTGEVLRGEMSANGLNVILSSNMGEYLTFQCDIRLSDDCLPKLDDAGNPIVTLRHSEAAGTQVAVARFVEEGCIRILLYSTDNTPMANNQAVTLLLESVSRNGDIEIENAGYSFRENGTIIYRPFEYGYVTGMESMEDVISSMKIKTQGEEISIYSPVDYQLPVTSVDGIVHMLDVKAGYNKFALKQGVYIIGKNKVIIK
ncbi:MAG: leucine-rich repeat protein [Bacteroidaceae bacterium]|nr:leucine-rich repeat protein [Bacteroidaceae bacterium]